MMESTYGVEAPFARGSWQHAVDDALVGYGRTSQEFATPHEAVRWLLQQTSDAALANAGVAPSALAQPPEWNLVRYTFAMILMGATGHTRAEWEQTIERAADTDAPDGVLREDCAPPLAGREIQMAYDPIAAQALQENRNALGYATRLACSMWGKHYRADAPNWQPADNLMGTLSQIDNMLTGMGRTDGVQGVAK